MNQFAIRPASEQDIDALIPLYIAFHEFHVHALPERLRIPENYDLIELRASLKRIIDGEKSAIFLASVAEEVVGLAEVYLQHDEPDALVVPRAAYGHLQSLMVLDEYRHHGIGTMLVAACEQWARERGANEMQLETWEFNAGPLRFYESLHYRTLKRTLMKDLPDL
jgi:GNAT superfamily N-acetyltransferase